MNMSLAPAVPAVPLTAKPTQVPKEPERTPSVGPLACPKVPGRTSTMAVAEMESLSGIESESSCSAWETWTMTSFPSSSTVMTFLPLPFFGGGLTGGLAGGLPGAGFTGAGLGVGFLMTCGLPHHLKYSARFLFLPGSGPSRAGPYASIGAESSVLLWGIRSYDLEGMFIAAVGECVQDNLVFIVEMCGPSNS